ncbi:MAG: response regulator transcription factor [Verrucomicrobiota bacterium]
MKTGIELFIVDDHPMVREGLKRLLHDQEMNVIGEAGTAEEALKLMTDRPPAVALIDIRLPGIDGIELAERLKKEVPTVRSIILTSFSDETLVMRAAKAGVSGYLLKEIDPQQLRHSIKEVAAGRLMMDPSANETLLRQLAKPEEDADPSLKRWKLLSPQEVKVCEHVAHGLINKEIASEMSLSEKTVKNYLANIFVKLDVNRRAQVAALCMKAPKS